MKPETGWFPQGVVGHSQRKMNLPVWKTTQAVRDGMTKAMKQMEQMPAACEAQVIQR